MKIPKLFHMLTLMLFMLSTFVISYAFADSTVTDPSDFFSQVLEAVKSFGGLSTVLKIASVITIIIASMKVSFLNDLVWSKLGAAKAWLAPFLGLLAGVFGLGGGGAPITVASVFAYISAGAGAVILHELLDSIKALPGIGPLYVTIINLIESVLGGPKDEQLKMK